ncbi:nitronate monooxygenase, partial [Tanacetum coccineum]
ECPDYLRELIKKTKSLTDKPFGVGIVLAFPHKENLKCVLEEKVAILQLYWGEVTKDIVFDAHQAGVKVVPQVSTRPLVKIIRQSSLYIGVYEFYL